MANAKRKTKGSGGLIEAVAKAMENSHLLIREYAIVCDDRIARFAVLVVPKRRPLDFMLNDELAEQDRNLSKSFDFSITTQQVPILKLGDFGRRLIHHVSFEE